jgi:hypothetical protein
MSIAAIAWIIVFCLLALIVLVTAISLIPEIRRYLRIRDM